MLLVSLGMCTGFSSHHVQMVSVKIYKKLIQNECNKTRFLKSLLHVVGKAMLSSVTLICILRDKSKQIIQK